METTEIKSDDIDQVLEIVMQTAMSQKVLPKKFKMTTYAFKLIRNITESYLNSGHTTIQVVSIIIVYLRGYVEGLRDGANLEREEIQNLA